jgi:type I restriction enzyme, S subunit
MGGEWQMDSLGGLIDVKHGFAFKGELIHDEPRGDVLLTPGNFAIGGGFKGDKFKYYDGPVPEEFVLREGDLLVTMTDLSKQADTLGYAAFVPAYEPGRRYLHNQRLGKVLIKSPNAVDARFLRYLLCSAAYRNEVLASATGTTVKHTSPERIKRFRFRRPPLPEQRAIADILGTLDDKIELNRRMNETLDAMARALFKSWFVEFDPVRAKAEGRDPGLPKPLANLFSTRLVDSELGEVPDGWKVSCLDNILVEFEIGDRPKGGVSAYDAGIPSIGAESIVGLGIFDYSKTKYVPLNFFRTMTKGRVKSRDVLLYKDGGRPGEFEPHISLFGDGFPFTICAINEHVYRLRAEAEVGQNFLFFWLSSELVMEEMRIKGTGVAVPGLNSTQVKSLTTLVPASNVTRAYNELVEPYVARVLTACNESCTLAVLRDTLLPKLISGELLVKDVERFIERAV